ANGLPRERLETLAVPDHGDHRIERDASLLTVRAGAITLVLNCRRGLAIRSLAFGDGVPLCGALAHGYYGDIHWGGAFYSAMTVMEVPGRPKTTDLNRVEPIIRRVNGDLLIEGAIATELGPVVKTFRVRADVPEIEVAYRLEWPAVPVGSLRLGDITLH